MMPRLSRCVAALAFVLAQAACAAEGPRGASAVGPGWAFRRPIVVSNPGPALRFFQVKVTLDAGTFDFDRARPDGSDLRFTAGDGWTVLPHWIERFDAAAGTATVWVKAPGLDAATQTKLYVYYGNPAAANYTNGTRAFDFFDDFGLPGAGYFPLAEPTVALRRDQAWERTPPHTLSVVELDRDGFRYWGYYGLVDCGGIGISRSNDLRTWAKWERNPLLTEGGERWPSVIQHGGMLYMSHTRDYCTTAYVALRKSADGANWGGPGDYVTLVRPEPGVRNQNSHLFFDPASGKFHLYWYRGESAIQLWQIRARVADTPEGLADPASERVLIEEMYEIAAPSVLYRDGTYYLSTEVNDRGWMTRIYAGTAPMGPFAPLPGNPVMGDNQACFFQHVFDGRLYGTLCKDTGPGGWIVTQRAGDLAGPSVVRSLDPSLWSRQGDWRLVAGDGGAGMSAEVPATGGLLIGSWAETDAAAHARIRLADGAGLAARVSERGDAMYAATFAAGEARLTRRDATGERVLARANQAHAAGEWRDVEIRAVGGAVSVWVDGERVVTADDPAPLGAGRMALIGAPGARFDDARLRKSATVEPGAAVGARETGAGAPGAWLGVRATPTSFLRSNPPAVDAGSRLIVTGAVILAAGLATAARLGRKR